MVCWRNFPTRVLVSHGPAPSSIRCWRRYSRTGASQTPIVARIAVHVDQVFVVGDDIYGPGINVAARLQEHSEPGGIVVSDAVFDLVRASLDRPVRDLGLLFLRNIPEPVEGVRVGPDRSGTAGAAVPPRGTLPSIAVLPLQNRDGDPGEDYFAEGIVEDITVSLASLHELLVIARGSSLAMSRQQSDPHAIGRSLGVRYVLAGNVRRTPNRVRVAVQLHDVDLGISLWGDTAEGARTSCSRSRTVLWLAWSPASRHVCRRPSCTVRCASGRRASPPTITRCMRWTGSACSRRIPSSRRGPTWRRPLPRTRVSPCLSPGWRAGIAC